LANFQILFVKLVALWENKAFANIKINGLIAKTLSKYAAIYTKNYIFAPFRTITFE
jgi:hypothetical protein